MKVVDKDKKCLRKNHDYPQVPQNFSGNRLKDRRTMKLLLCGPDEMTGIGWRYGERLLKE
jgi:hypothetical protein